jgi:hypothetical protein
VRISTQIFPDSVMSPYYAEQAIIFLKTFRVFMRIYIKTPDVFRISRLHACGEAVQSMGDPVCRWIAFPGRVMYEKYSECIGKVRGKANNQGCFL